MMANGSEGSQGLPAEAFASHAPGPDPSHDEHVAFPVRSLPPSAWAPAPAPPRSGDPREVYVESPQPGVRSLPFDPVPRHRRRQRAKPWIAALVLGAFLYPGATQTEAQFSGDAVQVEAEAPGLLGSPAEIRELVAHDLAPIQPVDQQLQDLSPRPRSVRIEVVAADDTNASVNVATGAGDGTVVDIPLPYAADVRFDGDLERLWVTVSPNDEQATVQCRVYADGELVAINTGKTIIECLAAPR